MDYDCANVTQIWMAFWAVSMLLLFALFGLWYYSSNADFWHEQHDHQKASARKLVAAGHDIMVQRDHAVRKLSASVTARAVLMMELQDLQSQLTIEQWAANEAGRK